MIISVIIRPREGLVPANTAQFSWKAELIYEGNRETILGVDRLDAESKAMAREAEIKAQGSIARS